MSSHIEGTNNPSPLDTMRHSAAHVMAAAVVEMFPEAKLAIGPPIEDGFYYDFGLPRSLTPDDFAEIERRMAVQIEADYPFVRSELSRAEAGELFRDQPYKLEIIEALDRSEVITTYRHGDFVDLCRGPHLPSTGKVGAYKILSVAAAYWRGDEMRPQLQRLYATAFPSRTELEEHVRLLERAKQRDHRKLGRELDLFSISEDVGPGLILWHPKGSVVRIVAEEFCRTEHLRNGYEWVFSPHIGRARLWQTSGHLDFFRANMYAPMDIEGEDYYAKPMNCPFHIQIFRSRLRSYRELPKRYVENGMVYRYERSGVLHGLTRVRGFTQDDAHIFCRNDQVEAEIDRALEFSLYVLRAFGLTDFHAYLSTRPEKAVGRDGDWKMATAALRRALEAHSLPHEEDTGGGAFYGPKIDLVVKDALGRAWQLSTIQFDFDLPERFGLEYIDEAGKPRRPYMVHRALLGSMERFFGVLIEQFGGAFPLWLAPVQAIVLPVTDRNLEYADQLAGTLREASLRIEVDRRSERLDAKIRDAQLQKLPYMLVVGDKEQAAGTVSPRLRSGEKLRALSVDELVVRMTGEVQQHV